MKRSLIVITSIVMILGLAACSQDFTTKLAGTMNGMSGNIYGIKANTVDVDKAVASVDKAVNAEGDVDLDVAAGILDTIGSVKKSDQKKASLKESLLEPSGTTAGKLAESVEDTIDMLEGATFPEEEKTRSTLAKSVCKSLESVGNSVSENPTKAEVASVAILDFMAKAIVDVDVDLSTKGREALDALSIITGYGEVNLLKDVNVQELVDSLTGALEEDGTKESVSRGGDNVLLSILEPSVRKIINLITVDGKFNDASYNAFVLQARATKTAYDMISYQYLKNVSGLSGVDALFSSTIDFGLSTEDLLRYVVSWVFVEIDGVLGREVIAPTVKTLLSSGNYIKLTNLSDGDIPFDTDAMEAGSTKFIDSVCSSFGINRQAIMNFHLPEGTNYTSDQLYERILRAELKKYYEDLYMDPDTEIGQQKRAEYETQTELIEQGYTYEDWILGEAFSAMEKDLKPEPDGTGKFLYPEDPEYADVPPADISAVKNERAQKLKAALLNEAPYYYGIFSFTEASLAEAVSKENDSQKMSDLIFSILGIVIQVTEMVDPDIIDKAEAKVTALGESICNLPGDLSRLLGTSIVILRDTEWDAGLLALLDVPSEETEKVSFIINTSMKMLLDVIKEGVKK